MGRGKLRSFWEELLSLLPFDEILLSIMKVYFLFAACMFFVSKPLDAVQEI